MDGIVAHALILFLLVVCGAAGLAMMFGVVYIWRGRRQYAHLPGPRVNSFFLGHLPEIRQHYAKGWPLSEILYQWCLEYGDVFVFYLLHMNIVVAVKPKAIKSVLVTEGFPKPKLFYKHGRYLFGTRLLGDGLVTEINHDTWALQRTAMNSAFSKGSLKQLTINFNAVAETFCNRLADLADGKTMLTMLPEFNRATLDVIAMVAYAVDMGSLESDANPYGKNINTIFWGMNEAFKNPIDSMNPFAKRSVKRTVRSACRSLRQLGREVITKRREALRNGDYVPDDVLTNIVNFQRSQPDDEETMEVAIDNFVTFLVAGQETTANMLSFAFMELGRHPQVLARLREEVDEVLGARQEVNCEDLGRLTYCENVIRETLRLYPPAALTFREVSRDGFTLEGHPVPKGTVLVASTYVCSRHPDLHPDPLEFRPERFEDDKIRPTPYTSFPFVLGPRSCIGQNFARMESKILLSKLVQRFDLRLDPTQSFDIEETTTLRPRDGTRAILTLREQPV